MVKKTALFFMYFFIFVMMLVYFAPKVNFYYYMEEQLKKEGVIISSEESMDKGFYLQIKNAKLSMKSISSADIEEIVFLPFVVYNSLTLRSIKLSTTFKSFLPLNIQKVKVVYTLFNPLNIVADASGEFGNVYITFNIMQKSLHLILSPSEKMLKHYKTTLRSLKKNQSGEFVYDKTF